MKSGNPKKSFIVVDKANWQKYAVVRRKLQQGKQVIEVLRNKNSVLVVTNNACEFCGNTYTFYGCGHKEMSTDNSTERFCSLNCANKAKGNYWKDRKRNPEQFHRGASHHSYGSKFKDTHKNVDWDTKTETELSLHEALKYKIVQRAIAKGLTIFSVIKIKKGISVIIKVITVDYCRVCGKQMLSDSHYIGKQGCSDKCSRILASTSIKLAYTTNSNMGTRNKPAWNSGIKVDKVKYPNWGKYGWLRMTEQEKIQQLNKFTKPNKRKIKVGNITYNVRSNFEADIVKFLYKNNIKFQYEPKLIKLETGKSYLPDFYLPDFNTYLEAKSLSRMLKCEKMTISDVKAYIKDRKSAIKEQNSNLQMLWFKRFYGNPEGSLLNVLQKVSRNPQRPEIEDNTTNNISVGVVNV